MWVPPSKRNSSSRRRRQGLGPGRAGQGRAGRRWAGGSGTGHPARRRRQVIAVSPGSPAPPSGGTDPTSVRLTTADASHRLPPATTHLYRSGRRGTGCDTAPPLGSPTAWSSCHSSGETWVRVQHCRLSTVVCGRGAGPAQVPPQLLLLRRCLLSLKEGARLCCNEAACSDLRLFHPPAVCAPGAGRPTATRASPGSISWAPAHGLATACRCV